MRISKWSKYAGQEGILTRWTTNAQKTRQIHFDDIKGASKKPIPVAYPFLTLVQPPQVTAPSTTTSLPTNPSFNCASPSKGSIPGCFVFYTHADYCDAHINQTLSDLDSECLSSAIDEVGDVFIHLSSGSGDATLAFFQMKLDKAQEACAAQAKQSSFGK